MGSLVALALAAAAPHSYSGRRNSGHRGTAHPRPPAARRRAAAPRAPAQVGAMAAVGNPDCGRRRSARTGLRPGTLLSVSGDAEPSASKPSPGRWAPAATSASSPWSSTGARTCSPNPQAKALAATGRPHPAKPPRLVGSRRCARAYSPPSPCSTMCPPPQNASWNAWSASGGSASSLPESMRADSVFPRDDAYALYELLHALRDNTSSDLREPRARILQGFPYGQHCSYYPATLSRGAITTLAPSRTSANRRTCGWPRSPASPKWLWWP